MSGLQQAVAAYNRATAELLIARRLLHRAIDADRAELGTRRGQARCGTPAEYRAHLRRDESPCPACTEAHRRDTRHRKGRNRR